MPQWTPERLQELIADLSSRGEVFPIDGQQLLRYARVGRMAYLRLKEMGLIKVESRRLYDPRPTYRKWIAHAEQVIARHESRIRLNQRKIRLWRRKIAEISRKSDC
jgi:hypothetical protein